MSVKKDATTPFSDSHTLMSFDQSVITEEMRYKAKEEINETDEMKETCLRELKNLLNGEKNLKENTSDEFLLQFLRAKKFRTQVAFVLIKNYYRHQASYPNVYKNFSPKQNLKVMNAKLCNFAPWRMVDGSALWVVRIGSWDPKDITIEEFLRFGIMCPTKALQNPVTQICGLTVIIDLKGFSWIHMWHISPKMIKCYVSMAQDSMPVRYKAIHIVYNPSIFSLLFEVMKPLITSKIRGRIYFHGYDLSSLHQHIDPSVLPSEFGGTRGPLENKMFYDSLLASEEEFLENQKFGYHDFAGSFTIT